MIKQTSALAALITLGSINLSAATITSSVVSGSCIRGLSELPKEKVQWSTDDPDGFQVFVAWDYAGTNSCEPTIKNPTGGFHKIEIIDGRYTVTLDREALEKIECGIIIQFDMHMRLPSGGLVPLGSDGFASLLYNSQLENRCQNGRDLGGKNEVLFSDSIPVSNGDSVSSWNDGTIPTNRPNVEITPFNINPTPVPEAGSTFTLFGMGLLVLAGRMKWLLGKG